MKVNVRRLAVRDYWFDELSGEVLSFHFHKWGVIIWWHQ